MKLVRAAMAVGCSVLGVLFVACGTDSVGPRGVDGGAIADAHIGPPPTDASPQPTVDASVDASVRFGLEERPKNPSCLAPSRPVTDAAVKFQPLAPTLSFDLPTQVAQAPGNTDRYYVSQLFGALTWFSKANPTVKNTAFTIPNTKNDWVGGFLCPCHGSMFDLAGRVFSNMPAPDNLEVPPHMYLSDTRVLIGEDKKA